MRERGNKGEEEVIVSRTVQLCHVRQVPPTVVHHAGEVSRANDKSQHHHCSW